MKKKTIALLLTSAMVMTLFPAMALALGHGKTGRNRVAASYAVCDIENCHITKTHTHGQICYAGHHLGDGHEHHQVCTVRGCALATVHEHNGVTCFPQGDDAGYGHRGGRGHHH